MQNDLYKDGIGFASLVNHMGEDLTIVNAARVSVGKESSEMGDREKKLAEFLTKHGHTSTYEHNIATFHIKVPLFISKQHMRHRVFSYNEISRRYTSQKIEFYLPQSLRKQDFKNRQASLDEHFNPDISWLNTDFSSSNAIETHALESLKLYEALIEQGVAREQARMILPQNLYTEYWCTGSLHNWMNSFIAKRDHEDAQWEMQILAQSISKQLKRDMAHRTFELRKVWKD